MEDYFGLRARKQPSDVPLVDQEWAFVLAAEVLTMVKIHLPMHRDAITSAATNREHLKREHPECIWLKTQSLQMAILDAFPPHGEKVNLAVIRPSVAATNLIRLANLRIKGTDDLRRHLELNTKAGIVWVFSHTVFMKEHLYTTKRMSNQAKR